MVASQQMRQKHSSGSGSMAASQQMRWKHSIDNGSIATIGGVSKSVAWNYHRNSINVGSIVIAIIMSAAAITTAMVV